MFTPLLATPFTVVVNVLVADVFETELIMGTTVPAIPLTVVERLFAAELLDTVATELLVAVTPLTVLVRVLPDKPNVCVIVAGAAFAGTHAVPFQVKACPLVAPVVIPKGEPLIFDTTAAPKFPVTSPVTFAVSAVAATPFIVLSSWLVPFWVSVLLLMILTPVLATPFTVVVNVFAE